MLFSRSPAGGTAVVLFVSCVKAEDQRSSEQQQQLQAETHRRQGENRPSLQQRGQNHRWSRDQGGGESEEGDSAQR